MSAAIVMFAVAAGAAFLAGLASTLHHAGVTPYAVAALWAVALWAAKKNTALAEARTDRVHRRDYHRRGARHRVGRSVPAKPLAIEAPASDRPFRARSFA